MDPYDGPIDPTVLGSNFLAGTAGWPAGTSTCYTPQSGYAHGNTVYFYNFGAQTDGGNPLLSALATNTEYIFDASSCTSGGTYNPVSQVFPRGNNNSPSSAVFPARNPHSGFSLALVTQVSVSGLTGETCNDIKIASSVTSHSFGAEAAAGGSVQLNPHCRQHLSPS